MPSSFETIINEIHVALREPVDMAIGRLAHSEHSTDAPRVSWIPIGGNVEPPSNVGGRLNAEETTRSNQIATRECRVDAYCWSGSGLNELDALEQTETLIVAVIAAAYKTTGTGDIELQRERWVTQDDATKAGWRVDGQLCILEFLFRIPVLGEVAPLYFPQQAGHACRFSANGGVTFEDADA